MRFETHSHSMYSNIRLIDSINKPKDLIQRASDLGLVGITLTDHEALCGHVEFLEAGKALQENEKISKDFKLALGNEIYLINNREEQTRYWHFILIAKNKDGYSALKKLSSIAWYHSYNKKGMTRVPTLKKELQAVVKEYPNTLIAQSACLGSEIAHLTLDLVDAEKKNDEQLIYQTKLKIHEFITFCLELFGEDFYLEVAPSASKDQKKYNKRIKAIAEFYNIKLVFGGDAHYLSAEDREAHKSFLNSKDGEREIDDFYYYAYLMNDEEAFQNCGGVFSKEEFDTICQNSIEIMHKIEEYSIYHTPIIPHTQVISFPKYDDTSLKNYPTLYQMKKDGTEQERYWINSCLKVLKEKKLDNEACLSRLEEEADIIKTVGNKLSEDLFSYFNTFQSYIDLFWKCGSIVGPGRGSSVCYLSNYLLGITQLNPLTYNLPAFRFLNKDRIELPDIDIDLSPSKRTKIFKAIRERVGETNLLQVATFTTAGTRSAILTACRGYRGKNNEYPKGIDIDVAQYLTSLVPQERGFLWTLDEVINGNQEKGRNPIRPFITEVKKYDGLLELMQKIEGLVVARGQHASGVIIYNNSCYDTNALMRSPSGDLTTQFSLGDSEKLGDVKFDFLVTEICDKIINTIDLLQKNNKLPQGELRQIYNEYLYPDKLNLNDNRMWDALAEGNVIDVFQFSTQVGLQAAKTIKPKNPIELMMANALTRLVGEKGEERPIDRYVRLRKNMQAWYDEVHQYGLTEKEIALIEPYYLETCGCPTTQEDLMLISMNVAGFSLKDANKARKTVAKKHLNEVPALKEKFEQGCGSKNLAEYVWKTCMAPQMSYSFARPHALAYSYVGIQVLYLATNYPRIYWNTSCLISDSGGTEDEDNEVNNEEIPYDPFDLYLEKEEEYYNELPDYEEEDGEIENSYEEEDSDGYESEVVVLKDGKKKKKTKSARYGKMASAIGKMQSAGISIGCPNINKSVFTFSPDEDNNEILFGLRGITRIGEDLVKIIIENRPYESIEDFLKKVKVNKTQMISLIKSGAFDCFGDRIEIMKQYVDMISDKKKRLTLQNMKMLCDFDLLPKELDFEKRVFNYNKYLKKSKSETTYLMDNIAYDFFEKNFDINLLQTAETESGFEIKQTVWDKIYKNKMEAVKDYIKPHQEKLLNAINTRLYNDVWNKYCLGSLSKWEMESISCYLHEHELAHLNKDLYNISNFNSLSTEPEVDYTFYTKDGKEIPIFKIERIAGTVLDRDKNKKTVTLLTTDGVVAVKIFGEVFANYDKQISEKGSDGKKHIIERGWFSKGNKIIVCGIKREDSFQAKKYSKTPYHLCELIEQINDNGTIISRGVRAGSEEN